MSNTKKHPGGRPPRYKKEFTELAYNYCLLGATDKKLASFFNVCVSTIDKWKKSHPEFLQSIKKAKEFADGEVVKSLYDRATGYEHPDTHISNYQGGITKTKITKHYPPDTTAMIFWLKNRQPELWRDKRETEISGKIQTEALIPVTLEDLETQIINETPREEE